MRRAFFYRGWIQAAATFLNNAYLRGFARGRIYTGAGKAVCVPGLNCYSCPGAVGSCPIGSLQAVISGNRHNFSFYVVGTLMLIGVLFGRLVCGFLCPFGWIQELLHRIPGRKLRVPKAVDRPLRMLKYAILLLFVLALPAFAVDGFGLGAPWFCKWICPAGTLEGGIPLVLSNESLRASLGFMFWWKCALLLLTIISSMLVYRPFCRYVCPLGAFYSLFNRFSLSQLRCDGDKCTFCGKCARLPDGDLPSGQAQLPRVHPLRQVHERLLPGRDSFSLWNGLPPRRRGAAHLMNFSRYPCAFCRCASTL